MKRFVFGLLALMLLSFDIMPAKAQEEAQADPELVGRGYSEITASPVEEKGVCNGSVGVAVATEKHFSDGGVTTNRHRKEPPVVVTALSGSCGVSKSLSVIGGVVYFLDPNDPSFANYVNELDADVGLTWLLYDGKPWTVSATLDLAFWSQDEFDRLDGKALVPSLEFAATRALGDWHGEHSIGAKMKVEGLYLLGPAESGVRLYPALTYGWNKIGGSGFGFGFTAGVMIPFEGPYNREEGNVYIAPSVTYTFEDPSVVLSVSTLTTRGFDTHESPAHTSLVAGFKYNF